MSKLPMLTTFIAGKMECDRSVVKRLSHHNLEQARNPQRHDILRFIIGHPPLNVEGASLQYVRYKRWSAFDLSFSIRRSVGASRLAGEDNMPARQSVCTAVVGDPPRTVGLRTVGLRGMGCVSQVDIKRARHCTAEAQYSTMETKYGDPFVISPTRHTIRLWSSFTYFVPISAKYVFLTSLSLSKQGLGQTYSQWADTLKDSMNLALDFPQTKWVFPQAWVFPSCL
jgi:hypothetical protein